MGFKTDHIEPTAINTNIACQNTTNEKERIIFSTDSKTLQNNIYSHIYTNYNLPMNQLGPMKR